MMVAGLPTPSWSIEQHFVVMDARGITPILTKRNSVTISMGQNRRKYQNGL
jgi:hypothetical protein